MTSLDKFKKYTNLMMLFNDALSREIYNVVNMRVGYANFIFLANVYTTIHVRIRREYPRFFPQGSSTTWRALINKLLS